MRSTNHLDADGFAWDGSPKNYRPRRPLRVNADSPTQLLRTAQSDRCTACGNRIEWYDRTDGHTVPLHPGELPTKSVPASQRWHVSSGLAYPADDGRPWCRIAHPAVCPARPRTNRSPLLTDVRRHLALTTRRLANLRAFTPPPDPPTTSPATPARPIVRLLFLCYLAPGPLERIRCVAQTRSRRRCSNPVLDPDALPGTWTLLPVTTTRGTSQSPLAEAQMAIYDLSHLPYFDQLRWRAQRCPTHAAALDVADIARIEWEPFNPHHHAHHINPDLPNPPNQPSRSR